MGRFLQHIRECVVDLPQGIFIKVIPTTDSLKLITHRCFELEYYKKLQEDLHCTVIYSTTPTRNIDLPFISKKLRFKAIATKLEYWPTNEGNIVLCLDSSDLQSLHEQFLAAGLKHSFSEYKPHVTLINPLSLSQFQLNERAFRAANQQVQNSPQGPMALEFYYGGYSILDSTLT